MIAREAYARRAALLKALAHPSRLLMLDALADGERCVCELQQLVGSDMSTVSKHLSVLREAGLLESRKDGLWVHYRLKVPVSGLLDAVDGVVGQPRERVPVLGDVRCRP